MGTGASVGAIDLPHSREVSTGLPNAHASGIKGVLRDEFKGMNDHAVLFGARHDEVDNRDQAALLISDAQLLCMPVIAYAGDFAWVTSPLALARYGRERSFCVGDILPAIPRPTPDTLCVTQTTIICEGTSAYLRDVVLPSTVCGAADKWAALIADDLYGKAGGNEAEPSLHADFVKRFAVVDNADFLFFSESGTEVCMRNRLDENKIVEKGALWSEENMPAECIFWGTITADTIQTADNKTHEASGCLKNFFEHVKKTLKDNDSYMQFGGKASVGRGQSRFLLKGPALT